MERVAGKRERRERAWTKTLSEDDFRPIRLAFSPSASRREGPERSDLSDSPEGTLAASAGRMCPRWVYPRTKWFLFGRRANCASHGGFVAAAARGRERDGPTRAKTRHALERNLYTHRPVFSASLNLPLEPDATVPCARARARARANDSGTGANNAGSWKLVAPFPRVDIGLVGGERGCSLN